MDQSRRIGFFDFLSHITDVDVEKVVISIKIFSSDPLHNLLAFQDASSSTKEKIKQVIFLDGQLDAARSTSRGLVSATSAVGA